MLATETATGDPFDWGTIFVPLTFHFYEYACKLNVKDNLNSRTYRHISDKTSTEPIACRKKNKPLQLQFR